ncbi:MAG: alpha/beta hydrolase [Bryobacterales bacterium]|nr:alpha/beta hydrolase [Bryobacterales bacterium]
MSRLRAADPPPPGQMVDLGGRRLHLNCTGSGAPSVIVENGGGGFSVEWALVQPLVARRTRICTYDRAGYAWSDRGPVDDGIEQIVDDLNLLLRTAHISPSYVLVGQSLGSLYIRAYQRRFPEQVAGLVFVDGTPDEDVRMIVNGKQVPLSLLSRERLPAAHREYLSAVPPLNPGRADAPPFNMLPVGLQQIRQWAFEKAIREFWLVAQHSSRGGILAGGAHRLAAAAVNWTVPARGSSNPRAGARYRLNRRVACTTSSTRCFVVQRQPDKSRTQRPYDTSPASGFGD